MSQKFQQLIGLHGEVRVLAALFCCLMEKIDGTSDPAEVAKVEALIEAAVMTFEETPTA
jgi:hypothetical protein